MTEISSKCGLIPPSIPPLPPDKPPDCSTFTPIATVVREEQNSETIHQPPSSLNVSCLDANPPNRPEIGQSSQNHRDFNNYVNPNSADSYTAAQSANPTNGGCESRTRKSNRNKNRSSTSSGDEELDRIRAEKLAQDHALMREAGLPPGGYKSANPKKVSVRIKGFKNSNHTKPVVKYGPALSDLRIKGFVEETQRILTKSKKGPVKWAAVIEAEANSRGINDQGHESDVQEIHNDSDSTASLDMDPLYQQNNSSIMDEDDQASPDIPQSVQNNNEINVAGINANPPGMNSGHKTDGLDTPAVNVWQKHKQLGVSFTEQIRNNDAALDLKLEYIPPVITAEGKCRVFITKEDLSLSAKEFPLYLYGQFLGTSMDFTKVNLSLKRLWKAYDISEISKSSSGYYFFKFTSEAGLTAVLENGPWLVNNVPIILNKWEPGLCLQRVEPKSIPIWVTVHDVPMELWTKRGMSIVFSGVGKPLLMDKVTQARVVNKTGKLGYARMLVDAQAEFKLPNQVEVEFPSGPNGESRIGVLEVTYQWKPQVCGHCVVFGHSTKLCKHQMTIVEPTAEVVMKAVNNQTQHSVPKGSRDVDDEFTKVTHKKKTSNFNPNDEKTEDHNSGTKAAGKQPVCSTSNRFAALGKDNLESNGFSVMDFDASLRTNSLVGTPLDMEPQGSVCIEKCTINQQSPIDLGRILPNWSQFSPRDSLNRILDKDYGITDVQKKRICDALVSDAKAVRAEDQEEWVDGEWEFFYDKCMELGLDPDFCVEDVYEDECGSAQFLSQLAKTGKYFDPVVAKPSSRK
ncbi:hypothetical protein HanHA300_Chr10g0343991 [Helianthus annuus]|nr:hypothetical protein HanHA300_Chr10g0343991 [Helianthus annuus]KAJ0528338.1 hypothetical protein HanHA89_Chr10g0365231 [Helianthus annuus]KAJ0798685.1 hypothetical protein HanLR1_Chr00c2751g0855971 [Helianthus annuus]